MHVRFALVIITSLVTSASALGDQRCPKITRAATGAQPVTIVDRQETHS